MVIYDENINDIKLDDIERIIDDELYENKYLEFKGEMTDGERDKILKTVCGFANADGGLFIYGLDEENKIPSKLNGISLGDVSWDDKKRTILNWIGANIEPRVEVEIEKRDLDDGNIVVLIKVPKSWNSPHCVKTKSQRAFYIRRDGSCESMDFEELRDMFDLNNTRYEKINKFRDERIRKFSLKNPFSYFAVFHAVPLDAFSINHINIEKAKVELQSGEILGGKYYYNFEGIFNSFEDLFKQLYRNGIFEMYYQSKIKGECITLDEFEKIYLKFAHEVFRLYDKLGIICPIVFFVSFVNVNGHQMCGCSERLSDVGTYDGVKSILDPSGAIVKNEAQIDDFIYNLFVPLWNHFGISRLYK